MNKAIISIAKEFKNATANAKQFEGFFIGEVLIPPPEVVIKINENILLDKTNLVFANEMLADYTREFHIYEGFDLYINNVGPSTWEGKGKIKWTDTIKAGQKVILVPAANDNMYIVIDKAVTFT